MDDPITGATKATEETAKAVQEVAKATGKAIDASQGAMAYLARLLQGPIEQAVAIWEVRLRYTYWEVCQRLLLKAQQFAQEHGLPEPTRRVPLNILVPL